MPLQPNKRLLRGGSNVSATGMGSSQLRPFPVGKTKDTSNSDSRRQTIADKALLVRLWNKIRTSHEAPRSSRLAAANAPRNVDTGVHSSSDLGIYDRYQTQNGRDSFQDSQIRPGDANGTGPLLLATPVPPRLEPHGTKRPAPHPEPEELESSHKPEDAGDCRSKKPKIDSPGFACPFYVRKRGHLPRCGSKTLRRVGDVRQHIKRVHFRLYYCPSCWITFKGEDEQNQHIESKICEEAPNPHKYATRVEMQEFKRTRLGSKTDEQRWLDLWTILFPERPLPEPRMIYQLDPEWIQNTERMMSKFIRQSELWISLIPPFPSWGLEDGDRFLVNWMRQALRNILLDDRPNSWSMIDDRPSSRSFLEFARQQEKSTQSSGSECDESGSDEGSGENNHWEPEENLNSEQQRPSYKVANPFNADGNQTQQHGLVQAQCQQNDSGLVNYGYDATSMVTTGAFPDFPQQSLSNDFLVAMPQASVATPNASPQFSGTSQYNFAMDGPYLTSNQAVLDPMFNTGFPDIQVPYMAEDPSMR